MSRALRKLHAFPFKSRCSEILRGHSFLTLVHLLVRWFSCPFELLEPLVPADGVVYDLGCGHGMMLKMLDSSLPDRVRLVGFDIDQDKIGFARILNSSGRTRYEVRDIMTGPDTRDASCIILNDVLHLVPYPDQDKLLCACHARLLSGGTLLIKEIDTLPAWKCHWAGIQETLVNDVFHLTRGKGLCYQGRAVLVEILERSGFQVSVIQAHNGYPYSHIIYQCKKI